MFSQNLFFLKSIFLIQMQYSPASAPSAPAHELSSSAALWAALCLAVKYPAPSLYVAQSCSPSHPLLFEKIQQMMITIKTMQQRTTPTATCFFSLEDNPSSA